MHLIFVILFKCLLLNHSGIQTQISDFAQEDCGAIPVANLRVVAYANSQLNKRVGSGECWDLANQALANINATWDHEYAFGTKINYPSECIFPGDIIQFEDVKTKYSNEGVTYQEIMFHHTAIIQKVIRKSELVLIHQNYRSKKKVLTSLFDIQTITQGTITIYRPLVNS